MINWLCSSRKCTKLGEIRIRHSHRVRHSVRKSSILKSHNKAAVDYDSIIQQDHLRRLGIHTTLSANIPTELALPASITSTSSVLCFFYSKAEPRLTCKGGTRKSSRFNCFSTRSNYTYSFASTRPLNILRYPSASARR